ncbi:uncharacterized protein LOC110861587 [Folsomia candida]|nr:uncharacterized protein LOC110861587 [Folsomia candida]
MASTSYTLLFICIFSFVINVFGQVCSPIGQICTHTTDCCKGCCEAHSCVDRAFSCSGDMIAQPGYETCARFYCPREHICYLREVCPPENACPRAPACRRVDFSNNRTDYRYYRNSSSPSTPRLVLMDSSSSLALIFSILLSSLANLR